MKLPIAFLLTVLVAVSSQAQYRNDSTEYVVKIQKYRDMRTVGTLMAVAGTGLFIAGLVIMEENLWWGSDQEFRNGSAVFLHGCAGLGAGIPLWIVGAHLHRKYSEKLKTLSLNFSAGASYRGLTIRYRF